MRSRAAIVTKVEQRRLLLAALGLDLLAPEAHDIAFLMALRLRGRPICRPVESARAKLGKMVPA